MSSKLITLEDWARAKYGERAPFIGTLRRWARDGKIFPMPKKHGRSYFVEEHAEYVDNYNDLGLMGKIRGTAAAQ